jgi:hypothetical protein
MTASRPPLTLAGGAVDLVARLPDGRVRCCYLDRNGNTTRHGRDAHAHELRGVGWHLAAIKAAIAALPLAGATPSPTDLPAPAPRPGAWLHVHHTAAED